jgi:Fe2+ or Zn2+ uptake regulation protein
MKMSFILLQALDRMTLTPFPGNLESWLEQLEEHGYRVTNTRRAVVEVIADSRYALTSIQVYDLARKQVPKLGLVTVYRTLEVLEEFGLVQRVHLVDGCSGYIASAPGHHHLLICQNCGRAEYFSGDDLAPLVTSIEARSKYQIHQHWLQLIGVCSTCQ